MSETKKPFIYPIVGTSFHVPAIDILKILPLNTRLELIHEPTNAYDPHAIAVNFLWSEISELTAQRLSHGLSRHPVEIQEQFINSDYWHLGYLPAAVAKFLRLEKDFPSDPILAELCFPDTAIGRTSNKPHVRFVL